MKDLDFRLLVIQDFREFRGKHKLDLKRLGLGVHFIAGVNLVEPALGSNGASKSSIWDALCWCLYGRTIRGLRGIDIRTWQTKNHARVEVSLTVNEYPIVIARSTESNGLWINGKVVDQATIDAELGLSYANFPHTIVIGQGQPLFFDLLAAEKMALLSETLDLDRWQERSKRAAESVQKIDGESRAMEGRLSELERTRLGNDTAISSLTASAEDWAAEREGKAADRDRELHSLRKLLKSATKLKGDHDLALESAETEAKASRKQKGKLEEEYTEVVSMVAATSSAIGVLLAELSELDKEVRESGDTCPTCGQSLKGTALAKHNLEIKRKVKGLEDQVETSRGLLDTFTRSRGTIKKRLDKVSGELRAFEDKADDSRDGFTRASAVVSNAEAQIKALEKSTSEAEDTANPFTALLRDARKQRTKITEMIGEAEALADNLCRKRERTKYWVEGFKNVRLYLLREVLDELQGVTQTLLPQIGLEDWLVEFDMEKETQAGKIKPGLVVNISNPRSNNSVKWESWSGGQGQRLRLVGAIALSEVLLRRAGVSCDLLVLDEPTRHLSPEGVRQTIDFLIDRGRDAQIFYVDHQAVESTRFASTITVTLSDKGAKIAA